jgi:hypothetical protein
LTSKPPDRQPAPRLTRLPEANEFSPRQVVLRTLLEAVQDEHGHREAIVEAIRKAFFADAAASREDPGEREMQQRKRAYNALLGASKYGLVADNLEELTPFGAEALSASTDADLYRLLARHIIRDLGGFEVLIAIKEMQAAGLSVSKSSLQDYLQQHAGLKLPRATTHHTKLLQWLRMAGVLPSSGYQISESMLKEVADLSIDDAETWVALTSEQKAFLRVLRRMAVLEGTNAVAAKAVIDAVETEFGPIFERPDQLAASVLKPLASPENGWITHAVSSAGRGGKSGVVAATQKLLETEVDLLPEGDGFGIPPDLKSKLTTPLQKIYEDLDSSDTYIKGVALELLALRMASDLTLVPTRLRERGTTTGGAEVDLIAEAAHLHFSRWLLQCKNTKSVGVSALAKEVGMAVLLKAHVVVMVTTGKFSSSVLTYADELAATNQLQAVLLDKDVLSSYRSSGARALRAHFQRTARRTLEIKRPQVVVDVTS